MKKISFLLFPLLMFAQSVSQVEYKGLIHISPVTASTITKITPYSNITIQKIDQAIKNLYKTGYFETIKVDYTNGVLTFICKEKPTIAKVHFLNVSEELKKIIKQQGLMPKRGEILSLQN